MSDRRTENDYESDDLLMNDDFELEDGVDDDLQEEKAARSRSFNMDMRLSLIHISEPTRQAESRMPSSA